MTKTTEKYEQFYFYKYLNIVNNKKINKIKNFIIDGMLRIFDQRTHYQQF